MENSATLERKTHTSQHSTGLLHTAFEEALERAAAQDLQGNGQADDPDGLFDGLPATNVERVMEAFEHYRQNHAVMDAAVKSAANFLQTPQGAAQLKALQASFESREPNPLSEQIARGIRESREFDLLKSSTGNDSLDGFGIGLSAGAAFFIGAFAGAEVIFDWARDGVVNYRAWYGFDLEYGITLNFGLELSFWNQTPLSGAIKGWIVDLWAATSALPVPLGLRYMYIKQRDTGSSEFTYAASTIQFPLEFVIPIGTAGRFWARQYSWSRRRRASVSVVDATTGFTQITVDTLTSLDVTIKNTSGEDTQLNTNATITINLPSYFTEAEVAAMETSLDGWTVVNDGTKITLTLNSGYTWGSKDTIEFTISKVESDGYLTNGDTATGYVLMALDPNVSHILTIRESADLGLVWANFSGTVDWVVDLASADGFTLTGASEGSVTGNAATGTTPVVVTTAVDSDGDTWNFGYIFTYTTENDSSVPEFCAAIWKSDASSIRNEYTGYYVVNEDGTSTAFYKNQSNATSMAVTVTLNS